MWWALLAGLLIFNKPFASIGHPPLFISEIAIAVALVVALIGWRSAFRDPLASSLAFRLIVAFGLLGVVRACFDVPKFGWLALRDSVIAGYGITAFIAAYVWTARTDRTSPMKIVRVVLPAIVSLAALWAALRVFGWIDPASWGSFSGVGQGKADLYAVSVAAAAWVWFTRAGAFFPREGDDPTAGWGERSAWALFALAGAATAAALVAMHRFQIRSVTVGLALAFAAAVVSFAFSLRRKILLGLLVAIALIVAGPARILRPLDVFKSVDTEYQLSAGLDPAPPKLPPAAVSAPTASPASEVPAPTPPSAPPPPHLDVETPRQDIINPAPTTWQESLERMTSVIDPDPSHLQSSAGIAGAYNVRWRAIFWVRCTHCVLHQAPFFGLGFGQNLTELMRDTPAWPLFVPSQQLDPPNRSPHCAHITVLTRMGLVGLLLWLSILALVSVGALRKIWRCGRTRDREKFWDGLMLLGVWLILLSAMSFGVILEGPMGGIWFWSLTGFMAHWNCE